MQTDIVFHKYQRLEEDTTDPAPPGTKTDPRAQTSTDKGDEKKDVCMLVVMGALAIGLFIICVVVTSFILIRTVL